MNSELQEAKGALSSARAEKMAQTAENTAQQALGCEAGEVAEAHAEELRVLVEVYTSSQHRGGFRRPGEIQFCGLPCLQ